MQLGRGSILADYSTLAESLASHGYIVVGSTPTGNAGVTVFTNGQAVLGTPQGTLPNTATMTEPQRLLGHLIQVWTADDRFVLDQVAQLNAADATHHLTGPIAVDAVGVLGHSFGGAIAAQFCHVDQRCRAAADLDGYLYGDVVQEGTQRPLLML